MRVSYIAYGNKKVLPLGCLLPLTANNKILIFGEHLEAAELIVPSNTISITEALLEVV
jgi:hypothetical protein